MTQIIVNTLFVSKKDSSDVTGVTRIYGIFCKIKEQSII